MTRRRTLLLAGGTAVISAAAVVAWASPVAPHLRVEGAYVPQPASPDVAAAYLTVLNSGGARDELTGVRSDVSAETMVHRSVGQRMEMAGPLAIPAHGRLVLGPGGYHVMIEMPVRRLRQGDRVRLTLRFRRSAAITVAAPVMPLDYRPVPRKAGS